MAKREIKVWEKLESKKIFDHQWLDIDNCSFLLPNGHKALDYYILNYNDWISVIAITQEGKFVMEKQYRPGIGKVSLEICGGVIDNTDHSPEEAARRELSEETGYEGGTWSHFDTLCPNAGIQTNVVHLFIAEGVELRSAEQQEDTEDISTFLMDKQEVKEALMKGEIIQAIHSAALWKYFCLEEQAKKTL